MGYYSSDPKLEKQIKCKDNSKFKTISELYKLLENRGWCKESVFNKNQWDENNKCVGQCNATALLVQEYFGGDVIKYPKPSKDKKMHYFNRLYVTDDKTKWVDIDLTSEQFNFDLPNYSIQTTIFTDNKYNKLNNILKGKLGL